MPSASSMHRTIDSANDLSPGPASVALREACLPPEGSGCQCGCPCNSTCPSDCPACICLWQQSVETPAASGHLTRLVLPCHLATESAGGA